MKKAQEIPGGNIKRTNQMFVALKEIGMLDDKGKKAMSIGYSGKVTGEPDAPLCTLVWPLITEIIRMARYSDVSAMEKDLAEFKKMIKGLYVRKQNESIRKT